MRKTVMGFVALAIGVLSAAPALAQAETGRGEGEVRRIDKAAGKITVRHGPLEGLDMPGMTMVFQTKDPALLDKLKVGEKIRFTVNREAGVFTIQSAEPSS